jgi:hypothetical protein
MTVKNSLWGIALLPDSQQSPFDFIREQGEELREQTDGLLWGEVEAFLGEDSVTYHDFQIASRRLGDYRCLLLRTAHADHVYPLYIYDRCDSDDGLKSYKYVTEKTSIADLMKFPSMSSIFSKPIQTTHAIKSEPGKYFAPPPDFVAKDLVEFKKQFAKILASDGTKAIIQSLLIQDKIKPD